MNQLYDKHNGSGSLEDKAATVNGEYKKDNYHNQFFKGDSGLILDSNFYMDRLSNLLIPINAYVELDNKDPKMWVRTKSRIDHGISLTDELIQMHDGGKFEFEEYILELMNREKLDYIYNAFSKGPEAVNKEVFSYVTSVKANRLWVSPLRREALLRQIRNGESKSAPMTIEPLATPAFSPA